jgi:hypothetical protein
MGEWIDFDRWPECRQMERPGIIFEVGNDENLRLFTHCVVPLAVPFDWKLPPVRFRAVQAPLPRHSTPIPGPKAPAE